MQATARPPPLTTASTVSRAGASSIADLTVIGRPAILVPYAHATGDHQSANARALAGMELSDPDTAERYADVLIAVLKHGALRRE